MKKLFTVLAVLALALSCSEKEAPQQPSGGDDGTKVIDKISLPGTSTVLLSIEKKEGKLLEVSLSPEGCTTDMLRVTAETEGIVSWSAAPGGILFKPESLGQTVVTIGPKEGPASQVSATVKVLSAEDYASVEISKIEIASEVYLRDGDTEGKTLPVKLSPAGATPDMLKLSGGEDVVTVTAVDGGLKFVPKKIGSANVKVEARRGSASAKTVNAIVLASDAYSDYVIEDIKYSPSKVEVKDNGTVDVTLTLTPPDATVEDILVSTADGSIATVAKGSGKVIKISGKSCGGSTASTKITVKGLREGSKSIEIPVKVYGHVTGISSVNGKDELMEGDETTLSVTLNRTGTLIDGDGKVNWSSSDASYVSVEEGSGKIKALKAKGSSVAAKITAKYSQTITLSKDIIVWSYPTGVTASVSGNYVYEESKYAIRKGSRQMIVDWTVTPSTAKQELYSVTFKYASGGNSGNTPGAGVGSVTSSKTGTLRSTVTSGSVASQFDIDLTATPVNVKSGQTVNGKVSFYVNEYDPSDIKPGDFVFYKNGSFYWADSGVRTIDPGFRKVSKTLPTDYGKLIGQVYSSEVSTADSYFTGLSKSGFSNKSGAHARVISVSLAQSATTKWSEDTDDVFSSSNWSIPSLSRAADKDFTFKICTIAYNNARGDSHDILPGKILYDGTSCFDVATFGSIQSSTSGSRSHTGWMLPSYDAALDLGKFGAKFSDIFFKLENKTNIFWLAEQSSSTNAYFFNPDGGSISNDRKTYTKYVRPILWL